MTGVFNDSYAATYDTVYAEKNYAAECKAVENLIAKFGRGEARKMLDLGCGTGRHAVIFAGDGFDVTGVDQSESMVARARDRATQMKLGANPKFLCGDIRNFPATSPFDVAVMNFNVIGYMASNDDALGALGAARKNLRQNGLLIADFWYGPAVVTDPPGENTREFETGDVRVVRFSSGLHLPDRQCCEITVKVTRLQGDRVLDEALETHRVRYFFPLELELMLRVSGFQLMALTGFPDIDAPVSARKWAAAVVAVAI
ncbi:class I SAM-dependent methyltransferase [Bradyrhizobium manausense]|uniref:class I SAM-dependent DNA methyltransferase n=1 Tax=Bradyrhizobium manausense TaxID=989370 RepID=UPI001BA6ED33|nr:class I SAM-dependent methyltransferase [Bradyrhizobium manausense]MBR1092432.1 class I SAM-dependent methyltransferase [Bradyrhizobium manausense]